MQMTQVFKCSKCLLPLEVSEVNTSNFPIDGDQLIQDVYVKPCELCNKESADD